MPATSKPEGQRRPGYGLTALSMDWDAAARQIGVKRKIAHVADRLRTICLIIAIRANADGEAWPGLHSLAADSGLGRRTVIRVLAALEKLDVIEISRRKHKSSMYRLNLAELQRRARTKPEDGEDPADSRPPRRERNDDNLPEFESSRSAEPAPAPQMRPPAPAREEESSEIDNWDEI